MPNYPVRHSIDGTNCPMCGAALTIVECRCVQCVVNGTVFATACECGFGFVPKNVMSVEHIVHMINRRPLQIERLSPSTN